MFVATRGKRSLERIHILVPFKVRWCILETIQKRDFCTWVVKTSGQRDLNHSCCGSCVQGDLSFHRGLLNAHTCTLAFMNSPDSHLSVKVINVLDCKWTKALLLSFHRRLSGNHLRHIPGPVLQGLYNLKVLWVTKDRKSESVFVSVNASMENNIQGDSFWKRLVAVSFTAKLETEPLTGDDSGFAQWWMVS